MAVCHKLYIPKCSQSGVRGKSLREPLLSVTNCTFLNADRYLQCGCESKRRERNPHSISKSETGKSRRLDVNEGESLGDRGITMIVSVWFVFCNIEEYRSRLRNLVRVTEIKVLD